MREKMLFLVALGVAVIVAIGVLLFLAFHASLPKPPSLDLGITLGIPAGVTARFTQLTEPCQVLEEDDRIVKAQPGDVVIFAGIKLRVQTDGELELYQPDIRTTTQLQATADWQQLGSYPGVCFRQTGRGVELIGEFIVESES